MRPSPETSRRVRGLQGTATIWRDDWGIPHVKAPSEAGAFFGLGWAHAQDRLWQMDMLRRRAVGRWAEWRGTPGLEADRLARRLGGERAARRDYEILGPRARAMLDAYAAGVNAFINLGSFPLEYRLLGEAPEVWEGWHSIAAMRQIGVLMGSFWLKLFRAAALPAVGPENVGRLRYDDGGADLLCMPQGVERERVAASLEELRPSIEALLALAAPDLSGGGSNNWAISGKFSETGRPILMGDPHRELEVPTMYAQAHIACDAFDAIGLTVPGVPGFPHVSHNGRVAYCVTHAFMDIHDLYVERFRNGGAEAAFKDGWEPVARRREVIKVRGAPDADVEIFETRHGPVIAGDPARGTALALRSVQFAEADTSFDCLPAMLDAGSVRELYAAVHPWGMIDHNLVAADVDGHIGHRVRAKVPRRASVNGWLPVPGWTGTYEWDGVIPPGEMPESIDPRGGRIVTANNRVVAEDAEPYLSTDCHPPHRARRIVELLDATPSLSADAMAPIFTDVLSGPGLLFRDRLRTRRAASPGAEALRAAIASWDGRMEGTAAGAAAYARLRVAVTEIVAARSGLAVTTPGPVASLVGREAVLSHLWWVVPNLLRADDEGLNGGATWSEVLDEALERAAAATDGRSWAEMHAPDLRHPLTPVFPEAAGQLDMACVPVGGDNDTVFATGFAAGESFATRYSALARTVFDVGDWGNSRWIVFQGASGDPASAHRHDQNVAWGAGATIPMLYDWGEIASRGVRQDLQGEGAGS